MMNPLRFLPTFFCVLVVAIPCLVAGAMMAVHSPVTAQEKKVPVGNIGPDLRVESKASSAAAPREKTPQQQALLGVHVSRVGAALRRHLQLPDGVGLLVDHVVAGSAAQKAGLKQYDVLHKLNDQILVNTEQLSTVVRLHRPKDQVTLTLYRNGKVRNMLVVLSNKSTVNAMPGFDAFQYFHGATGRKDLQNCALCHVGHQADFDNDGEYDNYHFFHGKKGHAKHQKCSACHARVVHPIRIEN